MTRPLSAWNKFVKKVFHDEKKKNPKCTFSEALKKASQLKKSGKMKGGLGTDDVDEGITTSGSDMSSSDSGLVGDSTTTSMTGQTDIISSSSMMGGKTRKRRSGKSKKSKKSSGKSRKSRKSKKSSGKSKKSKK